MAQGKSQVPPPHGSQGACRGLPADSQPPPHSSSAAAGVTVPGVKLRLCTALASSLHCLLASSSHPTCLSALCCSDCISEQQHSVTPHCCSSCPFNQEHPLAAGAVQGAPAAMGDGFSAWQDTATSFSTSVLCWAHPCSWRTSSVMSAGLVVGPPGCGPTTIPSIFGIARLALVGHHQCLDWPCLRPPAALAGPQLSPLGLDTGGTRDTMCEGLGCRARENPASWQPLCGGSCYWVSCSVPLLTLSTPSLCLSSSNANQQ